MIEESEEEKVDQMAKQEMRWDFTPISFKFKFNIASRFADPEIT